MAERERRTIAAELEVRAVQDGPTQLVGYAAVFNQESVIGGYFREMIQPGAFKDCLTADVRAQFNHGDGGSLPLGRTSAGTLRLFEDTHGLRYEIDMPDTQLARDLMVSVARGDVRESSFMFDVGSSEDETWDRPAKGEGQLPLRTLKRVRLYDVSPVVFPAYAGTSVSARAQELAKIESQPIVPPAPDAAAEGLKLLLEWEALEG